MGLLGSKLWRVKIDVQPDSHELYRLYISRRYTLLKLFSIRLFYWDFTTVFSTISVLKSGRLSGIGVSQHQSYPTLPMPHLASPPISRR